MTSRVLLPALVLSVAVASPARAQVPAVEQVPEPLRTWVPWVLRGHESAWCPFLQGQPRDEADASTCGWPARLELVLDAGGGRFTQVWRVFGPDAWVPLPGSSATWPQEVKVDGTPAATSLREDRPAAWMRAGDHVVTGTFAYAVLPQSLPVPPRTGLLALTLRGKPVAVPSRDASGLLWLQREAADEASASRLDVTVYRLVTDEIPLVVTTRVKLDVSGRSREVLLGRALLPGFEPMSLDGQLPARLEPDGRLRVQVRPGSWTLDLLARRPGPVAALALPAPEGGPFAPREVWVFDARPDLRVVEVGGAPAVDPQQTTLPEAWRAFPAFRLEPGTSMTFAEQRRGDQDPAPDRLSLARTLWLDFDGRGYTVQDHLTGTLERSWRLGMSAPMQLGRVSVGGQDQLVTTLATGGPGVEVRQGALDLQADSRIEEGARGLPAVGWDHDFHQVSAVLQLPPGWRLWHATGIDDVPATWLHRWSLLDLFLVLVISVAVGRLWGRGFGVLALAGLVLAFPEQGAPRWAWLLPLAAEALVRVLSDGRLARVVRGVRLFSWLVLVAILVPFAVMHVRTGMYPALERPDDPIGGSPGFTVGEGETFDNQDRSAESVLPEGKAARQEGGRGESFSRSTAALRGSANANQAIQSLNRGYEQKLDLRTVDPHAQVQTGPGLPAWGWQRIDLRWSGPVESTQRLSFLPTPPAVNTVLAFVRVILLALLFVRMLGGVASLRGLASPPAATVAGLLLLLLALPARAELPDDAMLEQLRTRLLEPPKCHPDCASSPRLALEATGTTLRIRQEFGAIATTGVPLPGGLDHWSPDRVTLDGVPAKAMLRTPDGTLWLALTPGAHQVVMEGALPGRDSVQLPLPLKPMRVDARLEGWTIDGLHDDGAPDDNLQLSRVRAAGAAGKALEPGTLPPFVRVERALLLGLEWAVETTVTRLTPPGTPIVLVVPLLDGEQITSADVREHDGKAVVNMGPRATDVTWRSVLRERPALVLTAPPDVAWTEVWRLEAAPVWHVETTGIPAVHGEPNRPARIPEWRPWPGETVSLAISRPTAVPGQTLTLQRSELAVTPGLRSADARLSLDLASSRGGQHTVTLPEGAQLQGLTVDGRALPTRQEGRRVTFPVKPGRQQVVLDWREPAGIRTLWTTPEVDLGLAGVNATLVVNLSRDRWVLLLTGPHAGPAVLFWSLLFVLLAVAAGMARIRTTPLKMRHWVLLVLGLTQVPVAAAMVVALWLLALGWRREKGAAVASNGAFDALQLALAGATVASLAILFTSIEHGLLGLPEMQVRGTGSSAETLRWFQDRHPAAVPRATVLSVPLLVYRGLMLSWALWIALALVNWLRWAWGAFTTGGYWRPTLPPSRKPSARPPAPPTAPG